MDVGLHMWGGGGMEGRHSKTNSIPSPWDSPSSVAPALGTPPLEYGSPAAQHHHQQTRGIGDGGYGSYMESGSATSSPLEEMYRRTASSSSLFPHSPLDSPSPQHGRTSSLSGGTSVEHGGGRRQSLSGPLPSQADYSSMGYPRRSSLSGPLPLSSSRNNPYSSPTDELFPAVRTPPPWSDFHMKDAAASAGTGSNPFNAQQAFSSPNGMSVASINTTNSLPNLSPSSLPRPPPHGNGGSPSSNVVSPNSIPRAANGLYHSNGNDGSTTSRHAGPPIRQLYDYKAAADPFASLLSPSPSQSSGPSGNQWASFPSSPSPSPSSTSSLASLKASGSSINGLSQRTYGSQGSLSGRSQDSNSNGEGPENNGNGSSTKSGSPNLTRSRSAHNGVSSTGNGTGGTLPFNPKGSGLNRSLSCGGAEMGALVQKFSKGRGGMGEGVLESLVAQLVFAQEKPSVLADMIFSPAKTSGSSRNSKGPFAYARDLVERILLAQVHAMAPTFRDMAQRLEELEKESWMRKNGGKVQESAPNQGYPLLRLQNQFVEAGLDTFDMLCRIRKQFPSMLLGEDGSASTGLLRIALFGGGPGCEAIGLRLFFMRLLPALQMQVDILDRRERWKEIVEHISLKGIGSLTVDLVDAVYHPTWLRSYRLLVFLDSVGEGVMRRLNKGQKFYWEEFWSNLYRNTHAGVFVIIHEKHCPWEEMRPRRGSNWWCSALAEQEKVHVARKM